MSLTPEQVKIIKATVPVVQEHGNEITVRIYEDMLKEVPDLNNIAAKVQNDAPRPDHYRISVKKEPALNLGHPNANDHLGYVSNILHDERCIGDVLQDSHPAGEFVLDTRQDETSEYPIVLVSAGVGLTPNLSILITLTGKCSKCNISWVHATSSCSVQAFGNHVKQIASEHDNVQTHVFNKEPSEEDREGVDYRFKGSMSLNKLYADHDLFIHEPRAEYYICGLEKFMADM
ncbi:hypothetical protein OEA41_002258 [Lepraria neglecta]|uniref:Oxidoreductase FAD/NAD(P)-binding domain-containing protein n=1 Tax=Lepraria neglecta TaxID=209136 RepID=A0AAD9ZDZ2_9LECA|nr:hypothetical protein OEA41_002258 [Lepraria neglecta]